MLSYAIMEVKRISLPQDEETNEVANSFDETLWRQALICIRQRECLHTYSIQENDETTRLTQKIIREPMLSVNGGAELSLHFF